MERRCVISPYFSRRSSLPRNRRAHPLPRAEAALQRVQLPGLDVRWCQHHSARPDSESERDDEDARLLRRRPIAVSSVRTDSWLVLTLEVERSPVAPAVVAAVARSLAAVFCGSPSWPYSPNPPCE